MAATSSKPVVERTDEPRKAMFAGTCEACSKNWKAGEWIQNGRLVFASGKAAQSTFHAQCPGTAPKPAAPAAAPAATDVKRAKFDSRCPGCGMRIEAGQALFFDRDLGKYVSDCCI